MRLGLKMQFKEFRKRYDLEYDTTSTSLPYGMVWYTKETSAIGTACDYFMTVTESDVQAQLEDTLVDAGIGYLTPHTCDSEPHWVRDKQADTTRLCIMSSNR